MKFRYAGIAVRIMLPVIVTLAVVSCQGRREPAAEEQSGRQAVNERTDAVTTASIVNTQQAFLNAAGANGTWIIATLNDLSIDRDIVLEGNFANNGTTDRKIALYAQDENRTVTERYTLTAPRLIVRSPNARLQGGTFAGDVIVQADNFRVMDATVQGNVYFANEQHRSTFKLENGGRVTGATAVRR